MLRDPYSFAVCLKESGEMIGAIGFHDSHSPHIHPENHEKELGYWLGVPFWGQGLMPEAIEAMLAFGFEELLLNAIWCGYYEGNEQSKRLYLPPYTRKCRCASTKGSPYRAFHSINQRRMACEKRKIK